MPDRGVTGPEAEGVGAGPSARVELARTLREWRARAGELPQKTVARRLNIAQTTVSRYESPDGRHPAPEAAVRALWSCYRLAEGDLDQALALRARVDEELRAGAASAKVAAPVPVAAVAVAAGAAVGEAVVVTGAGGPSVAPAAGRSRHRVAWVAGATAALAGVVAGGLLVHRLL
ncbi:helix-turn-helix domain-containing protein, partial [Kitasatospora sp. NPDC057518]|uniref:helix-turn-helix domain-containing protein n=1 Tax=Kitasatospora sp. NPDC057518 TaxID=3346155 RepID=UPI00368A93DB